MAGKRKQYDRAFHKGVPGGSSVLSGIVAALAEFRSAISPSVGGMLQEREKAADA